jgi:rare lipoprotein A
VWLAVNVVITIVLAPALFPGHHSGDNVAVRAGVTNLPFHATSAGSREDVAIWRAAAIDDTPSTTTTTIPPTTVPPTTAAPRPHVHTAAAPTTTTTAKPKPTTTTSTSTTSTTVAANHTESGKGTWYDTGTPGVCAHKTLPFGTVVTVTNLANGKSVTCTVHDRGPYVDGYIIDLNPQEFGKIAPLSAGVINARITW